MQAENTLMLAKKDVRHKSTTSRLMKYITSGTLAATAALFLAGSPSGLLFACRILGAGGTLLGIGSSISTHVGSDDAYELHEKVDETLESYREMWAILAIILMCNTSRDAENNARLLERAKRIGASVNKAYVHQKWAFDSLNEDALRILKEIDLTSESIKPGK